MARQKHFWLSQLGANIRQVRENAQLSQEKLAELADLDRTYIGGIERGERNVAALNLIRIAKALNTDVGGLFPPISVFTEASR